MLEFGLNYSTSEGCTATMRTWNQPG